MPSAAVDFYGCGGITDDSLLGWIVPLSNSCTARKFKAAYQIPSGSNMCKKCKPGCI